LTIPALLLNISRLVPLVSAVIPAYNAAKFLGDAVRSALEQDSVDVEVIVVDDGSTDGTRDVAESFGRAIRYVFQRNQGMAGARNTGLGQCTGDYVGFLDADDTWLPAKLRRQLAALARAPGVRAVHSACMVVDADLRPIAVQASPRRASALEDLVLLGNVVGSVCSLLVERRLLSVVGGFNSTFSHCADWELAIRLARHTEFAYVPEPLVTYRQHGANLSRQIDTLERESTRLIEMTLSEPGLPPSVVRRANEARARNWMALAGCYFNAGRYRDFARCAHRALRLRPAALTRLLGFPVRRLTGQSDWRRRFW
jgi:glycosyltransferase involved in cell wall biosynthesis